MNFRRNDESNDAKHLSIIKTYRNTLFQAQYLQEVLLRISSLLDNLHILSQMNERIEGKATIFDEITTVSFMKLIEICI